MKRTFYILTLLLFSSLTFAQTDSNRIVKIHKIVEQIDRDSADTTKTLDNEQFLEHMTDGGGKLTGYFKNEQLVKIVETVYLSSCINLTVYYLQDNKLIFVSSMSAEYIYDDSLATFDPHSVIATPICQIYFHNGKIIQSVFEGGTRCSGEPNNNWANNYYNEYSRYKTLLKKK